MNKKVLALAALAEAGTGVIVLTFPQIAVRLLFAAEIGGAGVVISRFATIILGVSCWPGNSALQQLNGMLTYGTLATLYFVYIGIRGKRLGCYCGRQLWLMRSSSFFSSGRDSEKKRHRRHKY
jgi:hypothetical protein